MEKMTIEKVDGLYLVRSGARFADHLTKDEVLGVVASALFSPSGPMCLRTYEEEVAMEFMPAGKAYRQGPKLALPPPRDLEAEFEYQKRRADANWLALCECRREEVTQ